MDVIIGNCNASSRTGMDFSNRYKNSCGCPKNRAIYTGKGVYSQFRTGLNLTNMLNSERE